MRFTTCLLVLLAAACAPPDPRGFCAQAADLTCDRLIRCQGWDRAAREECVRYQRTHATACRDEASIALGYQTFDGRAAGDCLKAMQARAEDCREPRLPELSCQTIARPASAHGAPCLTSRDCDAEAGACFGTGCQRTCRGGPHEEGVLGGPCNARQCAAGAFCDTTREPVDLCKAPSAVGGSCLYNDDECVEPAYCARGLCTARTPAGQPCIYASECELGTYCQGVCLPAKPLGAPCTPVTGKWGECGATAWCGGSSMCEPLPGEAGDCSASRYCQPPFFCMKDNVCHRFGRDGDPCRTDLDCSNTCDPVSWTCDTERGVGAGQACNEVTRRCDHPALECRDLTVDASGGPGAYGTCLMRQVGDSCNSQQGCPVGAHCTSSSSRWPGVCTVSELDSLCEDDNNCLAEHGCIRGQCKPRHQEGEECVYVPDCTPRTESCEAPFVCMWREFGSPSGVCGKLGGAGDSCVGFETGCRYPLECEAGVCALAGLRGLACTRGSGCIDSVCERANATDRGVCRQYLSAGSPCKEEYGENGCASGMCAPVPGSTRSVCLDTCN